MSTPTPPGPNTTSDTARLCALFAAGWLLFGYPLLGLWMGDATLLGVPLLPAALFVSWTAIIAALAWIAERNKA